MIASTCQALNVVLAHKKGSGANLECRGHESIVHGMHFISSVISEVLKVFNSVIKGVEIVEAGKEFRLVIDAHLKVEKVVLGSSELPKISRVNHNRSGSLSGSHVNRSFAVGQRQ